MKLIHCIFLLLFCFSFCWGQTLFSKQYYFNDHATSAYKIIPYDSSYLTVGAHSTDGFINNLYTLQINKSGIPERQNSISLDSSSFFPRAIFDNGDVLYVEGSQALNIYTPSYNNQIFLAQLDRNTLDTIWIKNYGSDTLHESTGDAIRTYDGGFAITGWAFNDTSYRQQTTLFKLDSLGNQEFYRHYTSDSTKTNYGIELLQTVDKGYLILGLQRYWTTYDNFPRRVTDMYIVKTDSLGEQEWMVLYEADLAVNERIKQPRDIIYSGDGSYYISGYNKYFGIDDHQSYVIYKVDVEGSIIWEKEYSHNQWTGFNTIIRAQNGNLIIAGYERDHYYIEDDRQYGIIASLTPEGDSLWLRKYFMSPDVFEIDILKDILETPDGGFIATGDTGGPTLEDTTFQYVQNAWVIRVDSLGCLEPGCDLAPVATEEILLDSLNTSLKIYPNPVSDFLTVDVGVNRTLLGIQIYDVTGRRVEDIQFFRSNGLYSYELGIGHLTAGLYVLQVRTNEGWISEKFIKQ